VRKFLTLAGSVSLLSALIVPAQQAEAAPPGSAFDPGLIISDSVFFDFGTMGVDQIQEFFDSRVDNCRADASGPDCLKDYVMDTPAMEAADGRCAAIPARSGATAAQIIYDVSTACGINPQVLIVKLQKEQGLVTSSKPTGYMYRAAMGYGCPDSDPGICGKVYVGLFNQLYRGASQLQWYGNPEGSFTWLRPGRTVNVRYSPRSSCGTKSFELKSQATANLYYYTPYTPNNAALNNMYGTGDSCSAYGNRNFWRFFHDWFGSPIGGGYLLQSAGSPLYVISGSKRYEITDPSQVEALQALGPVGEISAPYLESFEDGGAMQLLVESSSTQELFVLAGDKRYLVPNCEVAAQFGLDCNDKLVLPSAQLLEFENGFEISQLVNTQSGQYWIENGQYRRVFDSLALQKVTNVVPQPIVAELANLPSLTAGAPLTSELAVFEIEGDDRLALAATNGLYLIDPAMASEIGLTKWFDEAQGVVTLDYAISSEVPLSGFVKSSRGDGFAITASGKLPVDEIDQLVTNAVQVSDEFLEKVPTLESSIATPTLMKFPNSFYTYVVKNGQRQTVLQSGMLSDLVSELGPAITLPESLVTSIPGGFAATAPASVIRGKQSGSLFLIDGYDKKIPLGSSAQAVASTDRPIYELNDKFLDRHETLEPMTQAKIRCGSANYFLDEGKLIPTSPQVFAQYPGNAVELEASTCQAMGEQETQMTQFIRNQNREIFVVVQGEKFAMENFGEYQSLSEDSLGYNWVSNWFADNIPTGSELPANTNIVTEDGATIGDFISEEETSPTSPSQPSPTAPEATEAREYVVQPGDFLSKIAASQGTTVAELVEANNLTNANFIRVGQVLIIPGSDGSTEMPGESEPEPEPQPEPAPQPEPEPDVTPTGETGDIEYRVKSGDFLSRIASQFGVPTSEIVSASGLSNPNLIFVGQVLTIPNQPIQGGDESQSEPETETESGPTPEAEQQQTYVVRAGDTLFRIAARFSVSYRAIVEENGITNPNLIRVNQLLRIP